MGMGGGRGDGDVEMSLHLLIPFVEGPPHIDFFCGGFRHTDSFLWRSLHILIPFVEDRRILTLCVEEPPYIDSLCGGSPIHIDSFCGGSSTHRLLLRRRLHLLVLFVGDPPRIDSFLWRSLLKLTPFVEDSYILAPCVDGASIY